MIVIDSQTPSADIRAGLAPGPVLLAFSRGKDSIAAWLALTKSNVEVIPYHLDLIPNLQFVDQSIAEYETAFGRRIHRYPHPSFQRWLTNYTFQPPERCGVIDAANLWPYTYEDLQAAIRDDLDLDPHTWICEGVRACDSPARRIAIVRHGPQRDSTRQISAIWDWQKADVIAAINDAGIDLPTDYAMWGRSFDGINHRFLAPLRAQHPDDYQRILDWFPLADLELYRCDQECCHDLTLA